MDKPIKQMGITAEELLRKQFPLPHQYLGKWIFGGSLAMVYASAGTGKTFFSLAIAYAVAAGNSKFLNWRSHKPARVIYFDSEMGHRLIQERFEKICDSNDVDADPDSIKFVTLEDTGGTVWNLANQCDQLKYTEACNDFDFIIIDNLAGCVRQGPRETEFDTWPRAQDWLLKMRAANKSVLVIHHAGKNGSQRGPSARKDALDFVIELRKPTNHKQEQGLNFELRFEKCRHYIGEEAIALDVRLTDFDQERLTWIWSPLAEDSEPPRTPTSRRLFGY